ncbi:TVP38/TMEM64 family protein [Nesterenkonia halotolerans]|uniref:TVP38/TMEM64 family membrane protein n=1 Tax=Nesterenkonia halotolerans TaxID=225325 RepID=A0ABR9J430_9MICC|nr:VTT domain-containing protein [Nesterenkonia halotolerans]MBE1513751.1 putative membrane protein YdjX (TVP38/TMEM64 family) [Nesterenkonia halotolerans]
MSEKSLRPAWGSFLRNALLVAVLLVMVYAAFNLRLPSVDTLQSRIEAYGWAGWIVFVLLYAVVAMTPIPVTIMAISGGFIFGVLEGSLLSVIGVLIGCWAAYHLARSLGAHAVRRLLGSHAETVETRLQNAGFEAVFALRLTPGVPYWPVNYGGGAFGVTQRDFVVASVIATVPGQVSLVSLGAFIAEPSVMHGAVVGAAWIVVVGMTIWAYRSWRGTARPLPGA